MASLGLATSAGGRTLVDASTGREITIVAYVTGAVGERALVPVTVAVGALAAVLTTYWVLKRIRPLQAEIASIENYEATLAGAR